MTTSAPASPSSTSTKNGSTRSTDRTTRTATASAPAAPTGATPDTTTTNTSTGSPDAPAATDLIPAQAQTPAPAPAAPAPGGTPPHAPAADLTPARPSALARMAHRYHVDPAKLLDTLKQTAFKGATDAQMMALVVVANEFSLNPWTREIYAFPDRKTGGIVPVIGIDGWLRRINSHPQFDGLDVTYDLAPDGSLESCTATVFRRDRDHPVRITEYLSECRRNTDPWNAAPRRMLRHRAIIQCARVAFGFSGVDPDEAELVEAREARGVSVRHAGPGAVGSVAPRFLAPPPGGGLSSPEPANAAPPTDAAPAAPTTAAAAGKGGAQ